METLINKERPLVFCPGCSHEKVVHALDKALVNMDIDGSKVVIISDIGCSGLFDTFFNTHAFHGLHGRALTYAVGIKMTRPDLKVIVTMGDGGLGIGGAHFISTIRKNIDLTLLVLNNFNYGMTGGQASSTSPEHAVLASGFLNKIDNPIDPCFLAKGAGGQYINRLSCYQNDLSTQLENAINFKGFSMVDIMGICTGRYTKSNEIVPKDIDLLIEKMPKFVGESSTGVKEYTERYFEESAKQKSVGIPQIIQKVIPKEFEKLFSDRKEIIFLGGAGQRIITAGELLALAGITSGLNASQKSDYPITVLRGHSITEVVLQGREINFSGIENPDIIIAISEQGVNRRKDLFKKLSDQTIVIKANDLEIDGIKATDSNVISIDFKKLKVKSTDRALGALAALAAIGNIIDLDMLKKAVEFQFKGKTKIIDSSIEIINKVAQ
ncbi:MAG: 2-oxoacid:acceptor oxidoreductase family protein [Desulfobacterales bacterium]|nr:2-oxoacid:acceptor oxidoreductase family protein [Desulfobacterales bacterium]